VQSLRFAPDGRHVAVHGRDLSLWTSAGKLVARAAAWGGGKIDWSPDGTRIACMLDNSHVGLFRATDLGLAVRIDVPDDTCAGGIAFSPDGKRLAIGKLSATTYVLDLVAGRVVETLPGPADDDVLRGGLGFGRRALARSQR
jgi:WD40 repeat protein